MQAVFSNLPAVKYKLTKELTVLNQAGIHTRVSTLLFKEAKRFASTVRFYKGSVSADAKSVIEMLSLGAAQGETLRVEVEGDDAQAAMDALVALFGARFNEDLYGNDD